MVAHICKPRTPIVRLEEETVDSLETYELICMVHALENNKETLKVKGGGQNPRLSSDYNVHATLTHTLIPNNAHMCVHIIHRSKHSWHTYTKI